MPGKLAIRISSEIMTMVLKSAFIPKTIEAEIDIIGFQYDPLSDSFSFLLRGDDGVLPDCPEGCRAHELSAFTVSEMNELCLRAAGLVFSELLNTKICEIQEKIMV